MHVATGGWAQLEAEARDAFAGPGRFPMRAYSEFMPGPFVGLKPYRPDRGRGDATAGVTSDDHLDIDEYEQVHEVIPGVARIAERVLAEIGALVRGEAHALSRSVLTDNPAWPDELAAAGALAHDPMILILPVALSKTRDDKGNDRWTLFGGSHHGAARPFWHGLEAEDLARVLAWGGAPWPHAVIADPSEVTASVRPLLVDDLPSGVRTIATLRPFAQLPPRVRAAYLAGDLVLAPTPASLVFHEHPRYRDLALPHARQIPLLKLFPRIEESCALKVPQSGWLDEVEVAKVARTHRWQRVQRDDDVQGFCDKVTVALFSSQPDAMGLYDKPLARNVQLWSEAYEPVLDGPGADRAALQRAAAMVDAGGRFGYRFIWPAMRGGPRSLFWHLPVIARPGGVLADGPLGYVSAELAGAEPLVLAPRLLDRPAHRAAATQFAHDPGRRRFTTTQNARKLLDARAQLGAALPPSFARALIRAGREVTLDAWITGLPELAADRAAGARLAAAVRTCVGRDAELGDARTFGATANRTFEETIWKTIASLAESTYCQKNNSDAIACNRGRTGGPAAAAIKLEVLERNDLEVLGDHLHTQHAALIEKHGMTGRAEVLDHRFAWETDFEFPWMQGWVDNERGAARERNIVVVIPGRDHGEAVVMGDHYDTAYMEDVHDADRGGDGLRACAAGADDNHSATTALLAAADVLLPMAKAGLLERDVWLVHLTGEEFPADCLGARALAQALVERRLALTARDGSTRDVSSTRVVGVYVLDMIGHNNERDRDVFQIASGEGRGSAGLALRAHRATARWNAAVPAWNLARPDLGRAARMPDGSVPPPPFAHLTVHGEVRVEWEPRSALYNTDGQVFSDVGIPVVLFMENYDISRSGYHDTLDTMANIDLDYCAALTSIAIESVADAACAADGEI